MPPEQKKKGGIYAPPEPNKLAASTPPEQKRNGGFDAA
jgi:hypothetical protein